MKKILIVLFYAINYNFLFAQQTLTIEGTVINDTITGMSGGVNIPRRNPTSFIYRNNSITSVNTTGYMLQAGDEIPGSNNNNLDGEIITGNKFTWNGKDTSSTSHAVFTGYNINAVLKYNYLDKTPQGLLRKSNGMTDTSGGVAYNIVIDPKVAFVAKGINNVKVYNNTFYSAKTPSYTWRGLVDIYSNNDFGLNAPSTGTKVFNNIFYSKYQITNINIYNHSCLEGFESDYNIFWCEEGEPMFMIAGSPITFSKWQTLGYDLHSLVINPNFINFTDFVPLTRLDYGTNLGSTWKAGLSVYAVWGNTDPYTTNQNGTWQVGARIFDSTGTSITYNDTIDLGEKKVVIYPNPAYEYINISIKDPSLIPLIIRIIDISGNTVFTESIKQRIKKIKIPENILTGNYFVVLESGSLILYAEKLIIIK